LVIEVSRLSRNAERRSRGYQSQICLASYGIASDILLADNPTALRRYRMHIKDIVVSIKSSESKTMNTIIYIVGLVVVIGLVLSFFGMR